MKACWGEIGELYMTDEIAYAISNSNFNKQLSSALKLYLNGIWGALCESDKKMNDDAVKNQDDRILAKYNLSKGPIYIITEWDRSYTTIMFCDEY